MVAVYSKFTSLEGRYAKALYQTISSPQQAERIMSEGQDLIDLIQSNKDLRNTITRTLVNRTVQGKILKNIMTASGFGEPIINFVLMIARHNRLSYLEKIFSSFKEIHLIQQNLLPIYVKSAGPLDGKDKSYLDVFTSIIKKVYGANAEINYSVDPNLIAGFQIITSDKIIDGSLKKQLTLLKKFT